MTAYDISDYEQDIAELAELLEHPHRLDGAESRRVAEALHRIELYRPGFIEEAASDPRAADTAELARRIERFRANRRAQRDAHEISPGHEGITPMLHLNLAPQTGT